MSILIATPTWNPDDWLARFARHGGGRKIVDARAPFDPASIRYAVVWRSVPGLLASLPKLEAIFNLGAGVDALLADASLPDVPLCRIVNPDLTARMTEYVVLNVLLHLRRMPVLAADQAARRWQSVEQPAAGDLRVGIMGMGVLGRDAAEVLLRLGFGVSGWSRTPRQVQGVAMYSGDAGLAGFLSVSDILVVLLPLTGETRGILNAGLFRALPQDGALGGPVLINAGRGGLQVEADILEALDDGTLHAASLDVFETEPLPETSPLWSHPKVVITPHVAADSSPAALVKAVIANIERFEREGVLCDVVDRKTGY